MDNRIILAVAGSGKTTSIVDRLNLENRSLIITYTINNFRNLREKISQKFGFFPPNLRLMTYFNFLYSFCYRPFLSKKIRSKGITFKSNPNTYASTFIKETKQINRFYFMDSGDRLYGNRIAKLLLTCDVLGDVNSRITKYFENLFLDEIQDFAGHDFNLLMSICQINIEKMFVGDFYQHTYDTSRDGNVNANLHKNLNEYLKNFEQKGFLIDTESLSKSYRCSPAVCKFIRDHLGIEIYSHRNDDTKVICLNDQEQANDLFLDKNVIKLFLKEHHKFDCFSQNWGESKGENNYQDVCVVLNKTSAKLFEPNKLLELPPQTKNKLYVACSRANNNLYIINEANLKS